MAEKLTIIKDGAHFIDGSREVKPKVGAVVEVFDPDVIRTLVRAGYAKPHSPPSAPTGPSVAELALAAGPLKEEESIGPKTGEVSVPPGPDAPAGPLTWASLPISKESLAILTEKAAGRDPLTMPAEEIEALLGKTRTGHVLAAREEYQKQAAAGD